MFGDEHNTSGYIEQLAVRWWWLLCTHTQTHTGTQTHTQYMYMIAETNLMTAAHSLMVFFHGNNLQIRVFTGYERHNSCHEHTFWKAKATPTHLLDEKWTGETNSRDIGVCALNVGEQHGNSGGLDLLL